MTGSDPDDGDIIEMSPEPPRRTRAGRTWLGRSWAERTGAIGRRSRLVLIIAGACVLLAAGGTLAAVRLLQQLTPAEQAILGRLDASGSTPFLDFGGRAMLIGSGIPPEALAGLTWSQIAVGLRQPQSSPGLEILAAANTLTAEFCTLTGDRPATACPK
jgi:hypothetical protein